MAGLGRWYIEIRKQGFWRGSVHIFDNRYVLSGVTPDAADATTAINALQVMENKLFPLVPAAFGVGFVSGHAYAASGGPPFATVNFNVDEDPATATGFSGPSPAYTSLAFNGPLEVCLDVRIPLAGLSSTGKPVFCRKFYRGIWVTGESFNDTPILAADLAKVNATLAPLATGFAPNAYVVIGVSGRQPTGSVTAQQFLANHQVPRGRKRKTTTSSSSLASRIESALVGAAGESIAEDLAAVL
jgi:hypothetical protein